MANKDLTIRIKVANAVSAGLQDVQKRLGSFIKDVGSNLMNIKAGFDMISGAAMKFAEIAVKPIKEAFRFESATIQFKILMGSMDEAKKRMSELAEFAAKTPFELNELVDASKVLHTFSNGALGGIESMRLIGDAAAAVGEPFQEVAFWVGRAYTAIKSGEPFGRAALRLQELKLLTPETRMEMEKFQASGKSNTEVWEKFTESLKTFEGGMIQLSKTGDGLTSTLKDDWTAAVRTFGQEFSDQAKGGINEMSLALQKIVEDGTVTKIAKEASTAFTELVTTLKPVVSFLADIWIKSEQIRGVLGTGWKAAVLGPVGAVITQMDSLKKSFGDFLEYTTGAKISFSSNGSANRNPEVQANEKKNEEIAKSDEKSLKEKVRNDMEKAQAMMDAQKEQEELMKAEEELIKEMDEASDNALESQLESMREHYKKMAEEEEKAAEEKIKRAEENAKKLEELKQDEVDAQKEIEDNAREEQQRAWEQQVRDNEEIAKKTVKQFIADSRSKKDEEKAKIEEDKTGKRLAEMEARGTKLSKRDKEWLESFKAIRNAGQQAGVGKENLKQMELTNIATKQNELNAKLTAIQQKQLELSQAN